jgi:translation initiation factor IF-2
MNNGKVRIYELSRELNLDNRDILAVCDQLNIAVKSHSSTITEDEAAQIRTAAEKYNASHSFASKPNPSAHNGQTQAKKPSVQPPVKKQQILEIRRHRPIAEPPKRPEVEMETPVPPTPVTNAAPTVASPPPRPTPRLNVPPRPTRSDSAPVDEQNIAEVPPSSLAEPPYIAQPEPVPAQDVEPQLEQPAAQVREREPQLPAPSLVSPPSRPVARSVDASGAGAANRPLLKKARTEQGEPRTESVRVELREPSSRGRSIPITETEEPSTPKPKPIIELRRKPVRPAGETADKDASGTAGGIPPVPGSEDDSRRPTPPRPPKRAKGWEEEEEEEAQKPKAGTKAKRRVQVIEDDDDELEDVLNGDEENPVLVSLSLERPPKPKGRPGQAKPPTVTAAPTPKGKGRESSRNFRRDRREQDAKPERPEKLVLTGSLTVSELAQALATPETDIIKALFFKGIAANINQILDIPTATMVAQEMGIEVETAAVEAEARKITEMLDATDLEHLIRRPPVVTIMGHVDHGKTTLLDSIRKTKVAQGEAGGITQHIGAYHVDVEHEGQEQQVVFLDTPGHEAFTAMRARGARVTDIAILVVAADDGVRPQTIEAISHAKAAEVPIVVAINKVDKEGAQPDRVKQELTEFGLVPEEWGGDTIMVPVSAIKGENLDTLLEMILLVSEVEDLYANPNRTARGTVIEAHLDKARGPVATLLIQNGTLRVGDILVAGSAFGKVRAMVDDRGSRVDAASPSFAVEVLGLSDVPAAGDDFEVFLDEKEARSTAIAAINSVSLDSSSRWRLVG